jgi:predicted dehydrogenase
MNPTQISIAVAGAGLIGRAHIAAIQAHADLRLAALVDPAPAAREMAQQLGCAWFADLEALLQSQPVDGMVLATPNALHVPQAMQCIEAGVPCLLEKPIASTVQEAEQLAQAVQTQGASVLIGHHRAHSPIMAAARAVVQSGRLGRMVGVQGSACFYKPVDYFEAGAWRKEPGGGPILINMIHEVHNLRMLCGEISAVQAIQSHAVRGFAVEDTVAISLQFASGALGSFLLSDTAASARSWEQTSQENPSYPSYADEDCYHVSGTLGTLSVPTMRLKTYAQADNASWWKPFETRALTLDRRDPILLQMAHFAEVIRKQAQPLVSAHDGLANLRVTQAISEAAQSGQTIYLH